MTLTIELTPEQATRLQAEAKREGKAPADVVAALLDTLPAEAPAEPTWGERVLAQWQENGAFGLFADRPEDAPELSRKLREDAWTRDRTPGSDAEAA